MTEVKEMDFPTGAYVPLSMELSWNFNGTYIPLINGTFNGTYSPLFMEQSWNKWSPKMGIMDRFECLRP